MALGIHYYYYRKNRLYKDYQVSFATVTTKSISLSNELSNSKPTYMDHYHQPIAVHCWT